jgi:elongation factor G
VDSTADAFREAAERATEEALWQARPMILEALETVSVTVPEEFVEPVEASLAPHAGQTKTIRSDTGSQSITAIIPAAHVSDLIAELLRVSEGQACISTTRAGFRPRPEPPDTVDQWVGRTS